MRSIWLALYNSYRGPLSEPHRRAIARTGNLCHAFEFGLALFGFDVENVHRFLEEEQEKTTIGGEGETLRELVESNRIASFELPDRGWPPQLGEVVAATSRPERTVTLEELRRIVEKKPLTLVFGLGPRGMPKKAKELCRLHFDVTEKKVSLETATAIGAVAGQLALLGQV